VTRRPSRGGALLTALVISTSIAKDELAGGMAAQPVSVCATAARHGEPLDRRVRRAAGGGRVLRFVLNWSTRLAAISEP
jgi:hypothetical protein